MSKTTLSLFAALALNLVACGAPESESVASVTPTVPSDEVGSSKTTPTPSAVPSGFCQVVSAPNGTPYLTGKCQPVLPVCGPLSESASCPANQNVTGDSFANRCGSWVDADKPCS